MQIVSFFFKLNQCIFFLVYFVYTMPLWDKISSIVDLYSEM